MIALTLGLSMTLSAQAHMLWLERDTDKQTHAFFGEYSEQLKETQQGALKSFNQAKAVQSRKALVLKCNKIICFMRPKARQMSSSVMN